MARKQSKSGVNVTTVIILSAFIAIGVVIALVHMNREEVSPPELSRDEYPITGLDLSAHNGDVDFNLLVADSIDFVILKATEGATFKDTKFNSNYYAARKAGIATIGAYHFFRFNTDGKMQGINFLNSLVGKTVDLPLVIDLEEWTNPRELPTDDVVHRLQDMVDYLESNGYAVMLYTNKDGYERFVRNYFADYPLWICSFTNPPLPENADTEWSLWQYSHWGWVSAAETSVDLNTFNGTRAQWQQWLRTADF
jgi:lysozyme